MNEPLIRIENLSLEYQTQAGPVLALADINLELKEGEFVCLLGPSGCGKSTLLKIIAGYLAPTTGQCLMQGEPIKGPDWHRGVVFQSPTLYPWMNLRKNVEFGPRMRGVSEEKIREVSDHFLGQVKLTGFEDKWIFELSGGMKQRAELARALANEPAVILMDEPFGALDAMTRVDMQGLIREIWQKNKSTIFLITHDIDEALSLGTRVLVMSDRPGRILKEFQVDFTYKVFRQDARHRKYDESYFDVKDEIIDLIHYQDE
ncbi:ABC transporter ATP-binding protein [Alkalibacter rhizosphaerae]|uniref:ABC transporter ATP-binding protein n=1 Tax=Alkalibacter rhizosphaerae TaxID=2815577 RepID=A0A975AJA1_9FIRM|nr:ABC transporter ATP-binding protein [Alkalibacter rhizosphaerae]QSX09385.1 ABC transporter ATP-binding protein [Alkalibacter rhizosphaerae]